MRPLTRVAAALPLLGLLSAACIDSPAPQPPPIEPVPEPEPWDPNKDPSPIPLPISVDASRHLCDDRDGLQIAVYTSAGWGPRGATLLYNQHGFSYLLIDGHCNYWISNPGGIPRTGRNGTLSPDMRDRLERELHYQSWPGLSGNHCQQAADGGSTIVSDATAKVSCQTVDWAYRDVPKDFIDVFANLDGARAELWASGVDETGPLRLFLVRAARRDDPSAPAPVAWPLATDPESIAIDPTAFEPQGPWPKSLLIDNADDVAALRAVIAAYYAANPSWPYQILVQGPTGSDYDLFVRDVLPFDDRDGALSIPWLAASH